MTCQPINAEQWRLSFPEPESYFIANVMARLARHYQSDISQLPPGQRAYWQGTLTKSSGNTDENLRESQEMLAEARAELRSERLALAENWVRDFEIAESRDPWTIDVTSAERDEFVSMLNDRRLLLGLELGITEGDMEIDITAMPDDARRAGILEIDFLGHFIMVALGPQMHRP